MTDTEIAALVERLNTHWGAWGKPTVTDTLIGEEYMALACHEAAAAILALQARVRELEGALTDALPRLNHVQSHTAKCNIWVSQEYTKKFRVCDCGLDECLARIKSAIAEGGKHDEA